VLNRKAPFSLCMFVAVNSWLYEGTAKTNRISPSSFASSFLWTVTLTFSPSFLMKECLMGVDCFGSSRLNSCAIFPVFRCSSKRYLGSCSLGCRISVDPGIFQLRGHLVLNRKAPFSLCMFVAVNSWLYEGTAKTNRISPSSFASSFLWTVTLTFSPSFLMKECLMGVDCFGAAPFCTATSPP